MKPIITHIKFFTLFIALSFATVANSQTITTVAGNGTLGSSGNGNSATAAELNGPHGIAFDPAGNMYIADVINNVIRKVNTNGIISVFAGTGVAGNSGNGGQAVLAQLNHPNAVACDHFGNVFVCDFYNHYVRRIMPAGVINAYAGNGAVGGGGDGNLAQLAQMSAPVGVTVDANDNVYVTDATNYSVRKIDAMSNIITTVAGSGSSGYTGDNGPATSATLNTPHSCAFDAAGNMYIADQYNYVIRKVNALTNIITTVAGNGSAGSTGDGGLATAASLYSPTSVTFDAVGNMYITEYNGNRIRKVNTAGVISTLAGDGTAAYNGDNIPANTAELSAPYFITAGPDGNLYVGDELNQRVRKITLPCTSISAGNIISSNGPSFCSIDSTLLTLSSLNGQSGIAYQWQSSLDQLSWNNIGTDTALYEVTGLDATTYYRVIVTCTLAGVSDTASIIITPFTVQTVVFNISADPGTTVAAGTTVTFNYVAINGGSNPTYQWQKNGVDIPGATMVPYVTNALSDNDSISCIVQSNAICAFPNPATSNTLVMHITSGIKVVSANNTFNIYPDPNNGTFHLTGKASGPDRVEIQILNMPGQVVYHTTAPIQNNNLQADISLPPSSPNGLYLLQVKTGTGTTVLRFSKQ